MAPTGALLDLLRTATARAPDAPAVAAPDRRALSYGELLDHVEGTTARLRDLGVPPGGRVAIVLPNGPELATTFLATAIGATAAPLNPAYTTAEFAFSLGDLDPAALIVSAREAPPAAIEAARGLDVPVIRLQPSPDRVAGRGRLSLTSGSPAPGGASGPEDVALVLHTSGTTARAKRVPLTQANLAASAGNVARSLALSPDDRCLNVMPLFHIHGLVAAVLASLASGGTVVCTPGFYAPEVPGWLEATGATWYTAVPTMHQTLLPHAGEATTRLRFVRSSSAALPTPVADVLERAFTAPVVEAYGMTEAAHQIASTPIGARRPGSVGIPAGPEVAVVDTVGATLPPGAHGEVVIRGPNVTRGYEGDPEVNRGAFFDGWLRTGDLGRFDADGYLHLSGRLKEQINRGGEKISPREIDEVLLDHADVAQAVAFARPHPTLGEDVAAAVVLRPGSAVSTTELRRHAAARLLPFKVPADIVVVDEIPKGPTGKLRRAGLAAALGLDGTGAPQPADGPPTPHRAPRTDVERTLARLWAEVLGVETVGIDDAFLDLGGDSMLATRLLSRVQDAFDVEVPAFDFLDAATIAQQAGVLVAATGDPGR